MVDLPANVNFGKNPDGFQLDQHDDVIKSVQAFQNGKALIIEIWGTTTILTPSGERREVRRYQQNSTIDFDVGTRFAWNVTRWVFDASSDTSDATVFQVVGLEDDVPKYRKL
jgi:hypothetical protein